MMLIQRMVCELVMQFIEQEAPKHPARDCWYFKGVIDFKKHMFNYIEHHQSFAATLERAIIKESKDASK